jgi:hypothetical protein
MAYPSIAVISGELLFGSAGGYAIFNFYKTRDGSGRAVGRQCDRTV